ncbi:hypothetical protein HOLleu_09997 [Holothuria leucospilota]|uniref:Secreted protein n=1 Tax=Holothuria leucospilota TaxID=206669 RepID=A0A9Q1HEJ3_HOLLE|nr:hypothetical protein HOLleu_09997 [Holothuria leucospilota]
MAAAAWTILGAFTAIVKMATPVLCVQQVKYTMKYVTTYETPFWYTLISVGSSSQLGGGAERSFRRPSWGRGLVGGDL